MSSDEVKTFPLEPIYKVVKLLNPYTNDNVYVNITDQGKFNVYILNNSIKIAAYVLDSLDTEIGYSDSIFKLDISDLLSFSSDVKYFELVLDDNDLDCVYVIHKTSGLAVSKYNRSEIVADLKPLQPLQTLSSYFHEKYVLTNKQLYFILSFIKNSKYNPVIRYLDKLCVPDKDFTKLFVLQIPEQCRFKDKISIIKYPHLWYKYLSGFFNYKTIVQVPIIFDHSGNYVSRVGPFKLNKSYFVIDIFTQDQVLFDVKTLVNRLYSLNFDVTTKDEDTIKQTSSANHVNKISLKAEYGDVDVFETYSYEIKLSNFK